MPKLRWAAQGLFTGWIAALFDQHHHPWEGDLHFWLCYLGL